ncbi:MAG: UMP kinase [Candidatus Moranbacteria bacterium]|nr:UMP kinase [Candidatus Moranbacteria bacterium]
MPKETVVIDFGGSILSPAPGKIDFKTLKKFKQILQKNLQKYRFVVVVGGGKICRLYQSIARSGGIKNRRSLDWIGVRSTQLNAELMRAYLGRMVFPRVMHYESQELDWRKGILVSGGWEPGGSTDHVTARLAAKHNAKRIIVATNIDYIYDKDPKKYPNAKKQLNLTWEEFKKIIGTKWIPGMSTPFDPKATRICQKNRIPVLFLNGKNTANLGKALQNKPFRGSIIHS